LVFCVMSEVMVVNVNIPRDYVNLATRNNWLSSCVIASSIPYQVDHNRNHKLKNMQSTTRYILDMQVLLECCQIHKYINWKLTMEKLKSFQVSKKFALSGPLLSMSRCRWRYEAEFSVSMSYGLWLPLWYLQFFLEYILQINFRGKDTYRAYVISDNCYKPYSYRHVETAYKIISSINIICFALSEPLLSMSRCRWRYEAEFSVSLSSFISSSME
jgi:phage terminase large subunit-like protein